jgi:hypothetical protein
MKEYETYASGRFEITLYDDIGGNHTEIIENVVSKTERSNSTILHLAGGNVRQVFAPDYVTFLGDN